MNPEQIQNIIEKAISRHELFPWWSYILFVILSVLASYILMYIRQKGKNLATKEDIEVITSKIEEIRLRYESESRLIEMKRQLFEQVASSLKIFISGHTNSPRTQNDFLECYAKTWLWAPDNVVKAFNKFLELQRQFVANPGSVAQDEMKKAYVRCVIEMRKDTGFPGTDLSDKDYQFVHF